MGVKYPKELDSGSEFGQKLASRQLKIREALQKERKAQKVSLRQMAEAICIDPTTLSMLEKGKKKYLPFQMILGYSHVLKVPLMKLIFPDKPAKPEKAINEDLKKFIMTSLTEENQKALAEIIKDVASKSH